jgi:hypothetical protein
LPGEAVYDWLVDGRPIETIDLRSGLEELYSHPEFVVAANSELAYTADMMIYLRQYKIRAQELQSALEGAL